MFLQPAGDGSLRIAYLAAGLISIVVLWLYRRQKPTSKLPLAPQPPGLPLLGNLPEFIKAASKHELHLLIEKWHRTHGDLIRVKLGPVTLHFVGSDVGVKAVFDKQSAFTAERPRWIYSNEMHCGEMNVLLLDASHPRWKHQRRVTHAALTSVGMADKGLPYLHYETARFLGQVAGDPSLQSDSKDLFEAIGRYTYSTFAQQTFGMEIAKPRDEVISYIFETGEQQIQGTLPGSYLVDLLPVLAKLPLWMKPWERKGRAAFRRDLSWAAERLASVKRDIPNGYFHDAFLYRVVSDEKKMGFQTEEEAAYLALMLIIGAADTSRMSTWAFLECMMLFPAVLVKLQGEIDAVVGESMPVYEDLEALPYVRCVMKEVWRFRPPVTLGHPHRITKDLTYNGFLLPMGSRVQICSWSTGHDPRRHKDPEQFMPERFADDHTTTMESINSPDPTKRDHFAFGAGRRVCPGYHVAERSLAVAIMRIAWAFDIKPKAGVAWPLNPSEYVGFMPGTPGDTMPVTLCVRSEKKKILIDAEVAREKERHVPMRDLGTLQM